MFKERTRDDLHYIDTERITVYLADSIFCMRFGVEAFEPEDHRICRAVAVIELDRNQRDQ